MEKIIIRTKIVSGVSASIICESEENETFCDVIARIVVYASSVLFSSGQR